MPAEPKTQPTDASVADFIAAIEDPRRRGDAEAARALLREATAMEPVIWGTSIVGYGRYRGPTGDWILLKGNVPVSQAEIFAGSVGVSRLAWTYTGSTQSEPPIEEILRGRQPRDEVRIASVSERQSKGVVSSGAVIGSASVAHASFASGLAR